MRPQLSPRAVCDALRDALTALGIPRTLVRPGRDTQGQDVARFADLSPSTAAHVTDLLARGTAQRCAPPLPGAVLWDTVCRRAGEVTAATAARVRLRCLATGFEWYALPSRLRAARLEEICTALRARTCKAAEEVSRW